MNKEKRKLPSLKEEYATLDEEEREILKFLERGEWVQVKNVEKEKKKLRQAAINYYRKDATISMRLSSIDVGILKNEAAEEGIPYQTYIAGILHKHAMGKFKEIKKTG